jgi:hypothetical protein
MKGHSRMGQGKAGPKAERSQRKVGPRQIRQGQGKARKSKAWQGKGKAGPRQSRAKARHG